MQKLIRFRGNTRKPNSFGHFGARRRPGANWCRPRLHSRTLGWRVQISSINTGHAGSNIPRSRINVDMNLTTCFLQRKTIVVGERHTHTSEAVMPS
jgi:hypothetical protein